ncbi:ferrous iron efflux protein F [compost metagenome]
MNDEGFHKTNNALWGGLIILAALTCLMGVIGFQAHSISLLAVAAQTAAGCCVLAASFSRIRTMRVQLAGASFRGLDRPISIGSILLIVVILVIAVEMGIISVKSFIGDTEYVPLTLPLFVLVISLFAKEIMFRILSSLAKREGTEEFIANARRHRADIYSSIVAVIGIVITMLAHTLEISALYFADVVVGLIISLFISKMGFSLVGKTISSSVENVLQQEEADFVTAVQKINGVITVDELCAREHGHYVVIEMTIGVNPRLSVWEGHEVSKKIKQQLMEQYHHVTNVYIHVNPYDAGYPYKQQPDVEASELPSVLH